MSYQESLLRHFDSLKEQLKDAVWALTSCACKPAATVKVNGRTCTCYASSKAHQLARHSQSSTDKIIKALGEGGFSFVYLAQDEVTGFV
jgi:serine/threonine kinase 16